MPILPAPDGATQRASLCHPHCLHSSRFNRTSVTDCMLCQFGADSHKKTRRCTGITVELRDVGGGGGGKAEDSYQDITLPWKYSQICVTHQPVRRSGFFPACAKRSNTVLRASRCVRADISAINLSWEESPG